MLLPLVSLTAVLTVGGGLPTAAPRDVGMSAARLETVDRVVRRGVLSGAYPGAAVVVGRRDHIVWQKSFGRLQWTTNARPVQVDETIYDLASLTKVVATTTAAMLLVDERRLDLEAPVQRYLPDFVGPRKDAVTVRHLLTHQSGLPAGLATVRRAPDAMVLRAQILAAPIRTAPGSTTLYPTSAPSSSAG